MGSRSRVGSAHHPNHGGRSPPYKTPVEDVLPVSLDIRNRKHFQSLGLALVIDKSGSMNETQGGRSKIELAVEASSAAIDSLS